jgi:orotate phosphoribosyltransferase
MTLLSLLQTHGFRQGNFTLASDKKSDFYIDVRSIALQSEGHWLLGHELLWKIQQTFGQAQAVAGVELGGCPLASAVSVIGYKEHNPLPAIYVRKKAKGHGTGKLVEAPYGVKKGAKVVLLEDVITTGGSTIRAAESLKEAGYDLIGVVVVVDRKEAGVEAVQEVLQIPVKSLFTRFDFIPEKP